jgi:rSAM/selenodomain-associated transferase 2
MQLSIIIPTLNEADYIQQTLHHLQSLRQRGHEVIVVDGGSQDDTPALASGLADKYIKSERGRARQMNTGADHASGDILLFLHADTHLPVNADELIFTSGKNHPYSWGRFSVRFNDRHWMFSVIAFFMNWRSRLTGIATGDQVIFVNRNLFTAAGAFPEQPLMEDIELSKRLHKRLRPVCLSAIAYTSSRRWRQRGIIRTVLQMWWIRLAYFCGADPEKLAAQYLGK